ncbi:non-ribosomal peptide synthetase [Chitinophaga rhizophila]|uniref:Amino acid adenylation domain-containing protein n=1 Tax=Chitinophaga rhizophila TaxID=2866212 RepID=A0ABS7G5Y0_9BACT|nr:non-ribosomal peptide synthetase [Chitinophaga rhizophila]MBW8683032.1 amino acid adenylation domain-containing protein [Chitinophaga rhizophila]
MRKQTYELSPQQQLLYINSNDREPAQTTMSFLVQVADSGKLDTAIREVSSEEPHQQMVVRYYEEEGIPVVMQEEGQLPALRIKRTPAQDGAMLVEMEADSYFYDSWSLVALMHKILAAYNGRPAAAPEIDYLQYAAWKNQLPAGQEDSNRQYWENNTRADIPPKISFSTVTGKPAKLFSHTLTANKTLATAYAEGSQKEVMLLAAWYLVLWKLSGEEEAFRMGYVHHGRSFSQLYQNTGAFAITLPFQPGTVTQDTTLPDYISIIQSALNNIEEQKEFVPVNETYAKFAMTQLGFQFEYIDQELFAEEDTFTIAGSSVDDPALRLRLQVHHTNTAITATYIYDAAQFEEEDAAFVIQLWAHYCMQLLSGGVATIGQLPSLTTAMPAEENVTAAQTETVTSIFLSLADEYLTKTAVVDETGSYTYGQLDKDATALAMLLAQKGIGNGDRIGILCDAGYSLMVFMLGILKAGAAYVPVDATDSRERMIHIAADAALKYILTEEKYTTLTTAIPDVTPLYYRHEQQTVVNVKLPVRNPLDVAYVIYTSGTTGKPKGVAITDSSLVNYVQWLQADLGVDSGDSSILLSSYAFDLGYTATWGTVLSGGTIHFVDKEMLYQTDEVLKYILSHSITYLKLTPAYFGLLINAVNAGTLEHSALRMILLGGEKINVADVQQAHRIAPHIQFVNHYGPTETTVGCIAHRIDITRLDAYQARPVIGQPIHNNTAFLLDALLSPVSPGVIGNIYIGGAGLAQGYLHQPVLTAQKFIEHPVYGRLYATGDVGIQFLNGDILFLGRSDNQVKIRGYRVEPEEVRHVIAALPGISRAVVYVQQTGGEPVLVAFLISAEKVDTDNLKETLKAFLPDYMVPSFLVQTDKIPVTANNKTDYKQLDKMLEKSPVADMQGYSPVQQQMINLWRDVLKAPHLEADDNFFSAGGHSLKAIQLLSRVHKEFSVKLTLKDIYNNPTPYLLAGLLPVSGQEWYEHITPVPQQERYKVSNSQKRMWLSSLRKENRHLFNVPLSYRIEGALDTALFTDAFRYLIARHESLRTLFRFADGDIYQYVLPADQVAFDIPVIEVSGDPAELIKTESLTPFDLDQDIPIRTTLLKVADDDHILLITLHHIVSDGWSREIIYKEVIAVYNAMFSRITPSLKPLQIQYKDYVYWHERKYATQETFWKHFLSAGIPSVSFPLDNERPAMISHEGYARTLVIDGERLEGIRAVLEKKNINQTDFCIALFGLLLYQYTAQEQFIIGTITSGRTHIDLEPLIGSFINFLPLKMTVDPALTLEEYVRYNSQEFLKSYANEDYPFDLMVEQFVQHTDYSRNPVFDTTIIFHHEENMALNPRLASGAVISEYTSSADLMDVAKIDFKIDVTFRRSEMLLRLEYNTRLFRHETMLQFLSRYEQMLSTYPAFLDRTIGTLPEELSGVAMTGDDEFGELII